MLPARLGASWRLRQQQGVAGHHPVHALGAHTLRTIDRAFAIDQRAGAPVAVAWQFSDLLADVRQQLFVATRRAFGSAVNPRCRSAAQRMDIRGRQPERLADGRH